MNGSGSTIQFHRNLKNKVECFFIIIIQTELPCCSSCSSTAFHFFKCWSHLYKIRFLPFIGRSSAQKIPATTKTVYETKKKTSSAVVWFGLSGNRFVQREKLPCYLNKCIRDDGIWPRERSQEQIGIHQMMLQTNVKKIQITDRQRASETHKYSVKYDIITKCRSKHHFVKPIMTNWFTNCWLASIVPLEYVNNPKTPRSLINVYA